MTEPRATRSPPEPPASDEAPYRVAFENGLEAIVIAQDGVLRAVNPAACRLSGYSEGEMLGRGLLDLVHPEDRAVALDRYQRRISGDATERSLVVRVVRRDGGVLWLESHSMPIDWRGRPAMLVFFADVTDRETARLAGDQGERMFERLARVSPHFIFVYDYDLRRDVYINRSVPLALGYTAEQEATMQPYPFARLCHPEDIERAMERDRRWCDAADGTVDAVEFRLRGASGDWRWFRSLNTPFARDPGGRVRQILGVSEDVTELRRAEEAVRRGERLASLAVLAGGLAHDFGNLLTPVLGHAELLLARLPEGSRLAHHADSIRAAAEHAAELVEQLLVYAGRRPTEARAVDLNALVRDCAELHREVLPEGVELVLELAPELPPVPGDPSQLRQVVINLLTNAVEALEDRGRRITLHTRSDALDAAGAAGLDFASDLGPGPVVLLEVGDDGVGMDAATRARLWEPFFTTKPRGRGLGLCSTLGILRRHGAGLSVESRPGGGTRFRIYLPLAETGNQTGPARAAAGEP